MKIEEHNLHGRGDRDHEVYDMGPVTSEYGHDYWAAVSDVPCPVKGCTQTIVWYEAGYVPGYRVCMAVVDAAAGQYDHGSLRHRFLARGDAAAPTLVRDDCCEIPPRVRRAAAALGRRGGKIGGKATGASKRRTPEQYAATQAKALHSRRVKAAKRAILAARLIDRAETYEDARARVCAITAGIRETWGEDVLRDALALEG